MVPGRPRIFASCPTAPPPNTAPEVAEASLKGTVISHAAPEDNAFMI